MTKRKKKPAGTGKQTPKTLREKTRKNLKEMEKSDAERNNRKKKLLIAALIGGVVMLAAGLVLAGVLAVRAFGKNDNAACIAVPKEGGFVEAWSTFIPELRTATGIPELHIRTFETPQELEKLFLNSEEYNLMWAEVPVTGEYNFITLAQRGRLQIIDDLKPEYYIGSLFNVIQTRFDQKWTYALPYSCDLWVLLQRKEPLKQNPKYEIAVPGRDVENVFAVLTEVLASENSIGKEFNLKMALAELEEKSSNKTYQNNPFTYTNYDVLRMVLNGEARSTPIAISQYLAMSYENQDKYVLTPIKDKVVANATVLLFPSRAKEETQILVQKCQKALIDPKLNFRIAEKRNWQPVRIDTSSRNVHVSNIREAARTASYSGIPWLSYSSNEEKKHIFTEIQKKLLTK